MFIAEGVGFENDKLHILTSNDYSFALVQILYFLFIGLTMGSRPPPLKLLPKTIFINLLVVEHIVVFSEGVGFEPTSPLFRDTVFQTVPLDHSGTPPN